MSVCEPIVLKSIEELAVLLELRVNRRGVISVDGVSGAGKSRLGGDVARLLNIRHVDADTFLKPHLDLFVDALRIDDLRNALLGERGAVVFSGVCMLAVIERLRIPDVFKVYVKRMKDWGWADESEVYGSDLDGFKAPLAQEVRAYHLRYKPEERCDVIFERYALAGDGSSAD